MARGAFIGPVEPGFSLPVLERIAPPPPPSLVAARIDKHTESGDVVVDLDARGGWVARAAIDAGRRAVSIESGPLTRLLAELVLRTPDVRHLDAAFQAMAASAHGKTNLRQSLAELFASHCATCGRPVVLDDVGWAVPADAGPESLPVPLNKHYRCTTCRDQQGGGEGREAPLDDHDRTLAAAAEAATLRRALADRFALPSGHDELAEQMLALHTDRQLVSLAAILAAIEGELRAEPVEAGLRLAFMQAVLPASRLATHHGRTATLRIVAGRVRLPAGPWRERNPWLAFEEGLRQVRAFVQRLEAQPGEHLQARFGADLRSLAEGSASAVLRLVGTETLTALRAESEAADLAGRPVRPKLRLVLCQPPVRPTPESVALTFHATAWTLGRKASATVPIDVLLSSARRGRWAWQTATLRGSLSGIEPVLERDGRAVVLVDGTGPEPLVAASLAAVGAGFRLISARLAEPEEGHGGVIELIPPGAPLPPPARTRANVPLPAMPGGAGDPTVVPGSGMFTPPERVDGRPFSATAAARIVSDTTIELLQQRGEPARTERLLGEILVALDRSGLLRAFAELPVSAEQEAETRVEPKAGPPEPPEPAEAEPSEAAEAAASDASAADPLDDPLDDPFAPVAFHIDPAAEPSSGANGRGNGPGRARHAAAATAPLDQVDRLVALIRDELARAGKRRLVEVEPDSWWLADREDRGSAAAPLADRVEWAVYSLLSTGGTLSEAGFFERMATLFSGNEQPDEAIVRACLDSYRSPESTSDHLATDEDVLRRSQEHGELLASLADAGHRLGMHVWLGLREQARRVGEGRLGDRLSEAERDVHLPVITRAPAEALQAVDCIWYVRDRAVFMFEVEWTAMLGERIIRRHARIPPDEQLVRFLVVPPERSELVRHKIERSPLLRSAMADGNWHILKSKHLATFMAGDPLDLAALEPFLGLDPPAEASAEQLPLFGAGRYA